MTAGAEIRLVSALVRACSPLRQALSARLAGAGRAGLARYRAQGDRRHTRESDPYGYALRSPLTYARRIALSRVPLELWWSRNDLIVRNQQEQSGELFRQIKQINPQAAIEGFVGSWAHTAEMRSTTSLPFALEQLGLLPARFDRRPPRADYLAPSTSWPPLARWTVD